MKDQVTASRSESEASVRLARRVRFCSSVSTGLGTPASSLGSGVVGARSMPAMRRICSTTSAFTCTSGRHEGASTLPSLDDEPEAGQDRLAFVTRDVDADKPLDLAIGEVDHAPRRRRVARHDHARRLAAADLEHELRRKVAAGDAEGGIDAALEAVARVGDDAEPAAGLGDIGGIPQRAFDQNVPGGLIAARVLAAHDSGDQFDAVRVGDDDHALVERIGFAVEREHASRRARARRTVRSPSTLAKSNTCSGRPRSKVI